jgi:glycosyltransferase involved in cell wall biosynthesis
MTFNQKHRIQILHAHDASLFLAILASLCPPYPTVIWHDHFGLYAIKERPVWLYRLAVHLASGVIAVNQALVEWSQQRLGMCAERVWYIPNFVCSTEVTDEPILPGQAGSRIVCVANFRAQKDHLTLIRAMGLVVKKVASAHLILVGAPVERDYSGMVQEEIIRRGLEGNVSILGQRRDVHAILKACDIGVLSSTSEGLPLTLIEYGIARLAVVATSVGQCPEVLDGGRAGILVAPGSTDRLAEALIALLQHPEKRLQYATKLRKRVQKHYSSATVISQVCGIYETVLRSCVSSQA